MRISDLRKAIMERHNPIVRHARKARVEFEIYVHACALICLAQENSS